MIANASNSPPRPAVPSPLKNLNIPITRLLTELALENPKLVSLVDEALETRMNALVAARASHS